MKLLIIEDEPDLLASLIKGFKKNGYAVDGSEDGAEGLELYKINEYDLIILDLNLPSMDGLEVLSEIRKRDKIQRILILSARNTIKDKVSGLDGGANDYLPKPFDFSELDARVRALLRSTMVLNDTEIDLGGIIISTLTKTIKISQIPIDFAPREYSILEYLAVNRGRTVSAEELIEHVWDSDTNMFTDSVKVHISNIRKKLFAAGAENLLQTIRGQGYLIEKGRLKH